MKPVAIFRHARTEGPGRFADFLDAHTIPWCLIRIDAGDALPASPNEFSGLVFMGGPMSVNDDLPWIAPALALIRGAVAADIPVLGHCLGGQLMSKALGGAVGRNPVKEIGWSKVTVADNAEARRWFGAAREFLGFHWHGETFTIPPGAARILSSEYCKNQAFSLGKHLGFQCHIEMTEPMIREWCAMGQDEIEAASASPGVQRVEAVESDIQARVKALNTVAEGVYSVWVKGLAGN
jgi:GMP synthase-like glutamine amidotransferase